jgi:hypothetical protein
MSRTQVKAWGELKAEIEAMGAHEARERLVSDPVFRDHLLAHIGLLEAPEGRTRAELDGETLTLLLQGGFQIIREKDGVDVGLLPEDDIDAAVASGDWSGMLDGALDGMTWQIAHGYRPDLRGFGYEPLTAKRIADSEAWLHSMEDLAGADSENEAPSLGEAA